MAREDIGWPDAGVNFPELGVAGRAEEGKGRDEGAGDELELRPQMLPLAVQTPQRFLRYVGNLPIRTEPRIRYAAQDRGPLGFGAWDGRLANRHRAAGDQDNDQCDEGIRHRVALERCGKVPGQGRVSMEVRRTRLVVHL